MGPGPKRDGFVKSLLDHIVRNDKAPQTAADASVKSLRLIGGYYSNSLRFRLPEPLTTSPCFGGGNDPLGDHGFEVPLSQLWAYFCIGWIESPINTAVVSAL